MLLDRFFNFFTYDLGIDLGTSNTLFLVGGKGVAVREPTVVARNKKTKEVVAVGSEAKKMTGRTPGQLEVIKPLKDGVISDYDATVELLSHYIKFLHQSQGLHVKIPRPKVAIGIPTLVTEVERKAVQDAALNAGARQAFLIEEPMAAAIGAKLPIFEPAGALIIDIGGGTTELAVISLGGIVVNKSLGVAGDEMDDSIINYVRLKYSVLIGQPSAESLKMQIGSVFSFKEKEEKQMVVRGRDLGTGLPRSLRLNSGEIREALAPLINQIIGAISDILEEVPPELLGDLSQKGIYLSGGVSLLPGFSQLVTEAIKMPCFLVEDPLSSVVKGCGRVLADEKLLQKVRVTGGVK
jgi:rod shape-determining protein MreB